VSAFGCLFCNPSGIFGTVSTVKGWWNLDRADMDVTGLDQAGN